MYLLNKLIRKFAPYRPGAPSQRQRDLIGLLRAECRALDAIVDAQDHTGTDFWLRKRQQLRNRLLSEDPRNLMDFPEVRETMFVDAPRYIGLEVRFLRGASDWQSRWKPALRESEDLSLPRCPYFWGATGNAIHHAYHLQQLELRTGVRVDRLERIMEFGGGYGAMCRLVHGLGFSGRYVIFDLPEMGALQRYYLSSNSVPPATAVGDGAGAFCTSSLEDFGSECAAGLDLFIGNWSVSETPLDFRRQYLELARPRYWLIGYQAEFEGIDNTAFFVEWAASHTAWTWQTVALPHQSGRQHYLLGSPASMQGDR